LAKHLNQKKSSEKPTIKDQGKIEIRAENTKGETAKKTENAEEETTKIITKTASTEKDTTKIETMTEKIEGKTVKIETQEEDMEIETKGENKEEDAAKIETKKENTEKETVKIKAKSENTQEETKSENAEKTTKPKVCDLGSQDLDNGFYVNIKIEGKINTKFLVDSGSVTTLMSEELYDQLDHKKIPPLRQENLPLIAVSGNLLQLRGKGTMNISLGHSSTYKQDIVVSKLPVDGILGQDFLLHHASNLDYKRMELQLEKEKVPLKIGKQEKMSCQIQAAKQTNLPASSICWISVQIPSQHYLAETVLLEPTAMMIRNRGLVVMPAVSENKENITVKIVNTTEKDITLYPNQEIGKCESIYEPEGEEVQPVRSVKVEERKEAKLPEHLHDLLDRSSEFLDKRQTKILKSLLCEFQHVFSKSPEDIGFTDKVKHVINTQDAKPFKFAPRRQPLALAEAEKQEIESMLKRNIIEPSNSPWASPVTLVRKRDSNEIRFCVDYRQLNNVTVKDAYPLPRIDQCLESVAGNCWFSNLDIFSAFWQVPLDEGSKEKTAFTTKYGLYQFNRLPFGLSNSPATYERLMDDVLKGLLWEECLVFLDDTIIPSKTFEEGIDRLRHVLQRFSDANLKLKTKKCNLFKKEIKFLGHIVSEKGIATDPAKIEAVQDWPVPKSAKEVKSFIGLCTYYRKFVYKFAEIAGPLHRLSEKNVKFEWTMECQAAFDTLKEKLTSTPILSYPLPDTPFIVDTDASNTALGAVLSQVQDGKERPIAYLSKSLTQSERNYCVTRRELLAVVFALRKFHCYIFGQQIQIRTDNAAVSWMKNLKNPSGQTARWLQEIENYDLDVIHRPGIRNSNADALSRKPCSSCRNQQERNSEALHFSDCHAEEHEELGFIACTQTKQCSEKRSDQGMIQLDFSDIYDNRSDKGLQSHKSLPFPDLGVILNSVSAAVINDGEEPSTSQQKETSEKQNENHETKQPTTSSHQVKETVQGRQSTDFQNTEYIITVHPLSPDGWDIESLKQAQLDDPEIALLLTKKENNQERPSWSDVSTQGSRCKTLWAQWDRLVVVQGLLFRKRTQTGDDKHLQMIIPKSKKEVVMMHHHDIPTAGHLGAEKTTEKIKQSYYWPGMDDDVKNYCVQCDVCTKRKTSPKTNKAPLGQSGVGSKLERVSMDICGPFPQTERGNKYILVITDQFTKWTEAIPIPNLEAKTVADAFISNFSSKFGNPLSIHTDQGSNFESKLFKEVCDLLDIKKTRTTSMRPQSNGMVERFNRTLAVMLTAYCESNQTAWDVYLPILAGAYRSSVHSSTGFTPNRLMFGEEVRMPLSLTVSKPEERNISHEEYVANLQAKIQETHELARKHIKKNSTYQKKHYDVNAKLKIFHENQAVWLFEPIKKVHVCYKLTSKWKGPFMITRKIDDLTYLVKKTAKSEGKAYHVDRLLPYTGKNLPVWIKQKQ
jgi:hypothetical protein